MIEPEQFRGHTRIRLFHGESAVDGTLEYSPAESALMVILPSESMFSGQQDTRIKLDPRLLNLIQLLPDDTLQLDWEPDAGNPP